MDRVDATGTMITHHIVFTLPWDKGQGCRLETHAHVWTQADLKPGGELVHRDERRHHAPGTEETEARARIAVERGSIIDLHCVE